MRGNTIIVAQTNQAALTCPEGEVGHVFPHLREMSLPGIYRRGKDSEGDRRGVLHTPIPPPRSSQGVFNTPLRDPYDSFKTR